MPGEGVETGKYSHFQMPINTHFYGKTRPDRPLPGFTPFFLINAEARIGRIKLEER